MASHPQWQTLTATQQTCGCDTVKKQTQTNRINLSDSSSPGSSQHTEMASSSSSTSTSTSTSNEHQNVVANALAPVDSLLSNIAVLAHPQETKYRNVTVLLSMFDTDKLCDSLYHSFLIKRHKQAQANVLSKEDIQSVFHMETFSLESNWSTGLTMGNNNSANGNENEKDVSDNSMKLKREFQLYLRNIFAAEETFDATLRIHMFHRLVMAETFVLADKGLYTAYHPFWDPMQTEHHWPLTDQESAILFALYSRMMQLKEDPTAVKSGTSQALTLLELKHKINELLNLTLTTQPHSCGCSSFSQLFEYGFKLMYLTLTEFVLRLRRKKYQTMSAEMGLSPYTWATEMQITVTPDANTLTQFVIDEKQTLNQLSYLETFRPTDVARMYLRELALSTLGTFEVAIAKIDPMIMFHGISDEPEFGSTSEAATQSRAKIKSFFLHLAQKSSRVHMISEVKHHRSLDFADYASLMSFREYTLAVALLMGSQICCIHYPDVFSDFRSPPHLNGLVPSHARPSDRLFGLFYQQYVSDFKLLPLSEEQQQKLLSYPFAMITSTPNPIDSKEGSVRVEYTHLSKDQQDALLRMFKTRDRIDMFLEEVINLYMPPVDEHMDVVGMDLLTSLNSRFQTWSVMTPRDIEMACRLYLEHAQVSQRVTYPFHFFDRVTPLRDLTVTIPRAGSYRPFWFSSKHLVQQLYDLIHLEKQVVSNSKHLIQLVQANSDHVLELFQMTLTLSSADIEQHKSALHCLMEMEMPMNKESEKNSDREKSTKRSSKSSKVVIGVKTKGKDSSSSSSSSSSLSSKKLKSKTGKSKKTTIAKYSQADILCAYLIAKSIRSSKRDLFSDHLKFYLLSSPEVNAASARFENANANANANANSNANSNANENSPSSSSSSTTSHSSLSSLEKQKKATDLFVKKFNQYSLFMSLEQKQIVLQELFEEGGFSDSSTLSNADLQGWTQEEKDFKDLSFTHKIFELIDSNESFEKDVLELPAEELGRYLMDTRGFSPLEVYLLTVFILQQQQVVRLRNLAKAQNQSANASAYEVMFPDEFVMKVEQWASSEKEQVQGKLARWLKREIRRLQDGFERQDPDIVNAVYVSDHLDEDQKKLITLYEKMLSGFLEAQTNSVNGDPSPNGIGFLFDQHLIETREEADYVLDLIAYSMQRQYKADQQTNANTNANTSSLFSPQLVRKFEAWADLYDADAELKDEQDAASIASLDLLSPAATARLITKISIPSKPVSSMAKILGSPKDVANRMAMLQYELHRNDELVTTVTLESDSDSDSDSDVSSKQKAKPKKDTKNKNKNKNKSKSNNKNNTSEVPLTTSTSSPQSLSFTLSSLFSPSAKVSQEQKQDSNAKEGDSFLQMADTYNTHWSSWWNDNKNQSFSSNPEDAEQSYLAVSSLFFLVMSSTLIELRKAQAHMKKSS